MMVHNKVLMQKLGINVPIIQAPMAGGATTPELIAAVSNYGGLGSLGAGYMEPDEIKTTIRKIRLLTDKPFAVNLFIPQKAKATSLQIKNMQEIIKKVCPDFNLDYSQRLTPYVPNFDKQLQVIIEENVPVFSFTFGMLTQVMRKEAGAKNNAEFMSMWAGQGMHLCKSQSVVELMQELCSTDF